MSSKLSLASEPLLSDEDMAISERQEMILARRREILSRRMTWPPKTPTEIAADLGIDPQIVHRDLQALRGQLNATYFAKDSASRIGRAMLELDVVAQKIMAEIENPLALTSDRSALYGRLLNALSAKNTLMMETGVITKAATKVETSGNIQIDVTNSSVDDRIKALLAQREAIPVEAIEVIDQPSPDKPKRRRSAAMTPIADPEIEQALRELI